jgi:hypothetical protein
MARKRLSKRIIRITNEVDRLVRNGLRQVLIAENRLIRQGQFPELAPQLAPAKKSEKPCQNRAKSVHLLAGLQPGAKATQD